MTYAEIYGKPTKKTSEDLLTANIFGDLYHLPEDYLLKAIGDAVDYEYPGLLLKSKISSANKSKFVFWPKVTIDGYITEPDLAVKLKLSNNKYLITLIEVKHLSGKSSGYNPDSVIVEDQLARQKKILENKDLWSQIFPDLKEEDIEFKPLIFLTGSDTLPKNDIEESIKAINDKLKIEKDLNLYWISWWKVYESLKNLIEIEKDNYRKRILRHSCNILEYHKYTRLNQPLKLKLLNFDYSFKSDKQLEKDTGPFYAWDLKFKNPKFKLKKNYQLVGMRFIKHLYHS